MSLRTLGRHASAHVIRSVAIEAPDGVPPVDALEQLIGDARIVLIGEASHGTHEFYAARAAITRWLIRQKGFCAVAAEADWPDSYRVNRFVRGLGDDRSADQALSGFERFPAWMWRNVVVRDFVDWLRRCNTEFADRSGRPAGFYGLDLYSMHRSMSEVIAYLDKVDPRAAGRARERYACFDHVASAEDGQEYGYAAAFGAGRTCERQAIEQLLDMQRNAADIANQDGLLGEDEAFYAEQNAQAVRDAEEYYRTMFGGRVSSWNLRDEHMARTLSALLDHLDRDGAKDSKIVVWAHNSHVGDARATEVGRDGQLTLGQLVRERYGRECRLIGFSTYAGTVTAASKWGGVAQRKAVRPALSGSVEELLHAVGGTSFFVSPLLTRQAAEPLSVARLSRAIGVIYRPETERQSHYYHVRAADQYDAMIHIDRTRALEPLEPTSVWHEGETPETYPSGL